MENDISVNLNNIVTLSHFNGSITNSSYTKPLVLMPNVYDGYLGLKFHFSNHFLSTIL